MEISDTAAGPTLPPEPVEPVSTSKMATNAIGMAFIGLILAFLAAAVMFTLSNAFGEPRSQASVSLFGKPNEFLASLIIPTLLLSYVGSIAWISRILHPAGQRVGPAIIAILLGLVLLVFPFLLSW